MKKYHTQAFISAIIATILLSLLAMPVFYASADNGTTVSVKAEEMLTVQIVVPTDQSSTNTGDPGSFLYNRVRLNVTTNNSVGYTATLSAATTTTALTNQSDTGYTIPTFGNTGCTSTSYAYASFPSNCWGFSTDSTVSDVYTNTYYAVPASNATPAHVANSSYSNNTNSTDIYFGAKADTTKGSGTYRNTVVINVVSGVNTPANQTQPVPDDPVTPSDDNPSDTTPTHDTGRDVTVYTRTSTSGGSTTTGTTVTPGDTSSATYVSPAGVTTTAAINEGTPLATGLAVTAGVAATTGIIFFIVAKRRREDDEEEDYEE